MDDFEAFKKKKIEKEKADKQASADEAKFDEAAKKMGWVDGLGFTGAQNPKVKGFILGRSRKKKIDVKELKKPGNFETHRADGADKPKPPADKPPEKPPEKPKNYSKY